MQEKSMQELEEAALVRARTWEDELYFEYLASQLSLRSAHPRRLWVRVMAAAGARLARWGERLAQHAYAASAPAADGFAHETK